MIGDYLSPAWTTYKEYTFDIEGTFKAKVKIDAKTPEKAKEILENCRDLKEYMDYDIEDLYIEDIGGWIEE